MSNIVFVGAHPDDIEISAAGYIKYLLEKGHNPIYNLILSNGEIKGGWERHLELRKAFMKLGIKDFRLLDFADGFMEVSASTIRQIEEEILKFSPDYVFTHFPKDTHQDHRAAAEIVKSICFRKNINLIYYDSNSSFEFYPNFFVPINWTFKKSILKIFKSQMTSSMLKRIKAKAAYYGSLSGNDYAEGYFIERMVCLK